MNPQKTTESFKKALAQNQVFDEAKYYEDRKSVLKEFDHESLDETQTEEEDDDEEE